MSSLYFQFGMLVAGGLALMLYLSDFEFDVSLPDPMEWLAPAVTHSLEPSVTVMLVESRNHIAEMRAAVAPERIVASTPHAIALSEGRVIATSMEAASEPINLAGWAERPVEIMDRPGRRATPSLRPTEGAEGDEDAFRALKDKKILTHSDSMKLLKQMEQNGDL